jgi:hypothetical protein
MNALTDDERAVIEYIRSSEPPATQPVPPLLTESLRRIVGAGNQVDALRQEYRRVADIALRYDVERGAVIEAGRPATSV